MSLLSILLSQTPVRKLELTYQEFIDAYLDKMYNVIIAYDESYIDIPERTKIEEKLDKCLQEVKEELITNVGYLPPNEKYSYLLMLREWIIELTLNRSKLERKVFDWEWDKDYSESTLTALNKNTRIVNETLFPIYERTIDRLLDFHTEVMEKYEKGILTQQSPKEIAEIIISYKPQFILSENMKLQSIPGKEKTTILDKYQTTLLFALLKEKEAIIDLNYTSFANVLCRLTPHSEKVLARLYELRCHC